MRLDEIYPDLRQFMHEFDPSETKAEPRLERGSIATRHGRLYVVVRTRDARVTALSEDGERIEAPAHEFMPLDDESLESILEQRTRANEGPAPQPELPPRPEVPPPGGNAPAPSREAQRYCRVSRRRWSGRWAQATVEMLNGFIEFTSTVIDGLATLPDDGFRRLRVEWAGRSQTKTLKERLAQRIAHGSIEDREPEGPPGDLGLEIAARPQAKGHMTGLGVIRAASGPMTVETDFTVFKRQDGWKVELPSWNYRDTVRFRASGEVINHAVKGACLMAWARVAGIDQPRASRPVPKGHPRCCGSCRHHAATREDRRSTWELRKGVMAPRHFCLHPAAVARAGGPVPLDTLACRRGNEALSRYNRDMGESAYIWLTPHRRGTPTKLRDDELWTSSCPLHTFQAETDPSCVVPTQDGAEIQIFSAGEDGGLKILVIPVSFQRLV